MLKSFEHLFISQLRAIWCTTSWIWMKDGTDTVSTWWDINPLCSAILWMIFELCLNQKWILLLYDELAVTKLAITFTTFIFICCNLNHFVASKMHFHVICSNDIFWEVWYVQDRIWSHLNQILPYLLSNYFTYLLNPY